MDLIDRKRINNKELPKFYNGFSGASNTSNKQMFGGFGNSKGGQMDMVSHVLANLDYDFMFDMMSDKDYFSEYYDKYGSGVRNYGGFQFKKHNTIDEAKELSNMDSEYDETVLKKGISESIKGATEGSKGGAIGAAAGGIGGFIWGIGKGSLLGDSERDAKLAALRAAKIKQNAEDFSQESIARSNKYSYDWYTKHPAYKGSYLGAYNNGIEGDVDVEKMQTRHKHLAHTPYGIKNTKVNAMVSPGEIIVSKNNKSDHTVTGDPTKIDEEPAYVPKGGKVASNNKKMPFPGTNMTFAQVYPFAKAAGLVDPFFAIQKQERNNMNYKNGLHAADFGWENIMSTVPGMIETAFDYNKLKNEDIKLTNTRAVHPYSGVIQDLLNRRNVDIYPMLVDAARHEANTRYSINNSAHSNATKTLLNMVNSMNSRTARMKAFMDAERMRNDFAKESAAIYNDMGKSLMTSNLAAEQFNTQMNNQAHNAKIKMLSQKRADKQNLRSQFARDAWQKKQFDWMMNYYNQDQEYKNAYLNWLMNNGYNNVSKSTLKNASKKIDNNGLYGIRFTPDTLNARHDLYKKYQIDPFTRAAGELNSKFKFENPFIFKS